MSRPRQILAIGASRGGVGDVFGRAVAELRARGHAVQVVVVPSGRWPAAAALRTVWRTRRLLAQAESVHIEFGSGDVEVFWFALAATRQRADCVVVAHDHPELAHHPAAALVPAGTRLGRGLAHRVLCPLLDGRLGRRLLGQAGVLVVLGEAAARERRAQGVSRVLAIRHGSDPPGRELAPPSRGECVLFAGFVGPGKGVDVLLAAWRALRGDAGLPLVLAGAATPPNDAWLASQLTAGDSGPDAPRILGEIPDEREFQGLIERAAVVVLPYRRSSPASGILVRAMRAGRAIVATPVPAVEGLIEDGHSGLLVPPGDAGALAQAIRRLAGDPPLRDRLGAAAAATAARELTWQRHVAGLERAYAAAAELGGR